MMQYIEEGKSSGKPFMAMIATQAVHSPLQAPNPDIEKYMHRYDVGWEKIRLERYQRQVNMGLVPAGLSLPVAPGAKSWETLSDEQRRDYSKKMAVYAGMLDNANQHTGRLIDYLKKSGPLKIPFSSSCRTMARTLTICRSSTFRSEYGIISIMRLGYETLGQAQGLLSTTVRTGRRFPIRLSHLSRAVCTENLIPLRRRANRVS